MKKRILCNLLVLALLLGLLPTAALAGGGSWLIWSEDFEDPETWADTWSIFDANDDGCGWDRSIFLDVDGGGGCVTNHFASSPQAFTEDVTPTASDDYLISPVIDLAPGYEYGLTCDAKMIQADGAPPYTFGLFYVIDAEFQTDPYSLRVMNSPRYSTVVPYPEDGWKAVRYDLTAYAGRQIRLLFHHKDPTANELQLDNFRLTQYESDSHVERICVTNVPEPEVGLGVPDMRESSIVIDDSVNLALVPGSLQYYRTIDEQAYLQNGDFAEGGEYDVRFQLRVKDGAFTYSNCIASVNGRGAGVLLDDKGTPEDSSDDIITVYYYYGELRPEKKPLDFFSVFVTPPVAGNTPSKDVAVVHGAVEVTYAYWCLMKQEEIEGPDLYPNETFSGGQLYRCYFTVKPDHGYYFDEEVRFLVNGDAHSKLLNEPAEEVWFHVDFTAQKDAACTVRFCTEYGDPPADVSGAVGTSIPLPVLPDQPAAEFCGWGYRWDDGEDDLISGSFRLTHSCTLYAVWQDLIDAPAVGIATDGLYAPATDSRAVVDPYAPYSAVELAKGETVSWWTEQPQVGAVSQRYRFTLESGTVYYGLAILEADKDHRFSADADKHLQFSGAELDAVSNTGRQLRLSFHMQIPGMSAVDKVGLLVPTLIPGSPVDGTSTVPICSLTPGVSVTPLPGVWKEKGDVGDASKAWGPGFKPGGTFYAECVLHADGAMTFGPGLKLAIDGATEVSRESVGAYGDEIRLIYALKIMDTGDFQASVRSTDETYPCGHIRTDYHAEWESWIEGPYTPAGERWIKAMPEPGYTFREWRSVVGEKQVLSTDNPYFFTLEDALYIEAVFAPSHTVAFLNAHGDAPASQTVPDGGLASEPKGLTADDFLFRGWFTDPTCEHKYDFSTPVTGDLILYTGWEYAPGMRTDKTLLNQCLADADALDTSYYTDESVAALQKAIAAARKVQDDPTVSQDTVDGVLDDLNNAVFGLVLKTGAVDKSALEQAIADAEALDTSCYTVETVTALAMTLTGAGMVLAASEATQADVDAAVQNIKTAVAALELQPGAVDKNALSKAIAEAEAIDLSKCFPEDAEELKRCLAKARDARDKAADQAAVDAAEKALREVIDPVTARIRTVDDFFAVVKAAESYKEEDYTPESFAKLKEALETAHSIQTDDMPGIVVNSMKQAAAALREAIGQLKKKDAGAPFADVASGKFYYDAVIWAVEHDPQITNGVDAAHFGPDKPCTRGHVVTFLWRAAGCPEPAAAGSPFTDLKPGAFYEKAVAWAVEQGITKGTSETAFSPDATCTRGQIVTFLYRFKKSPAAEKAESPFTDLKPGAFYEDAVAWAVANKVTNGVSATAFAPDATCTRGQVVTFLYRAAK